MAVNLQPLIQLHFLDREIASLNGRLSQIPVQMKDVDRKLDRALRHVQEKQNLIAENQKKRRELEGDLALIEAKRKKIQRAARRRENKQRIHRPSTRNRSG
jgi:predicted  nucleic acid-binding Zn-ribbon protein